MFALAGLVAVLLLVGRIAYRLLWHPLARYPGPRLAAATHLVELYYDVILRGQYVFKIQQWHKQYGPVLRINPDEIHIDDAEALLTSVFTHNPSRAREKYEVATRVFGAPQATIATVGHDLHRMRRNVLARLFNTDSIRRVEGTIQATIDQLCTRLNDFQRSDEPVNIGLLYSAFTADVVTEYAFAESHHYLEMPDLNKRFFDMTTSVHEMGALARYWKWMMPLMMAMPPRIVTLLDPGMREFFTFQDEMRRRIRAVQSKGEDGQSHFAKLGHRTVFHDILMSDLPAQEKTVERLWQEAEIVSIAGTETTAWTLAVITYYLLSNPPILSKLRAELLSFSPPDSDGGSGVTWKQLEKLPYLSAVIQEGLRLSFGVTSRFVRTCPDETIHYQPTSTDINNPGAGKSWHIPAGTPISTSGPLHHLNPSIFPDPLSFHPDRWLDPSNSSTGAHRQKLDKHLWSFSKGSRQCLGMNLAYAEMFLVLYAVFRRYGGPEDKGLRLELHETTREDVAFRHDLFVPFPSKGSMGVRVVIKE